VSIIRGEYDGYVTLSKGPGSLYVGITIHLVVAGKCLTGDVKAVRSLNQARHVSPYLREFFTIHTNHADAINDTLRTKIKHRLE